MQSTVLIDTASWQRKHWSICTFAQIGMDIRYLHLVYGVRVLFLCHSLFLSIFSWMRQCWLPSSLSGSRKGDLRQVIDCVGFNDTSTLVDHCVLSPREREKRDRKDSRWDEREGRGRKWNRNESEEIEEKKNIPPLPLPATRIAGLA